MCEKSVISHDQRYCKFNCLYIPETYLSIVSIFDIYEAINLVIVCHRAKMEQTVSL